MTRDCPNPIGLTVDTACSVLVPSCDAYSDLWTPFFTLFWRYWNDCPFPVYLGSNEREFQHPRVTVLHSGHGTNWANRVREQVAALETPYVLLCLEDFFLRRPVPTGRVQFCLEALGRLAGHMVRLERRPGPDRVVPGLAELGEIDCGAPYRVSTQTAIWKKETLLALMKPDESIWEFELNGSVRSSSYPEGFFCVWNDVMTYDQHVVERGKWFRGEARRFGRAGVGCNFNARSVMTEAEMLRWHCSQARSFLLNLIPWRQRLHLVKLVRSISRAITDTRRKVA
jgi:hypothetical protein